MFLDLLSYWYARSEQKKTAFNLPELLVYEILHLKEPLDSETAHLLFGAEKVGKL